MVLDVAGQECFRFEYSDGEASLKSSCIQHPDREPLVILRQSYIELCGGDRCAAMLLANFEYWHNVKLDQSEQEIAKARDNPDYKPDLSLWFYKSSADLEQDLLGCYARKAILKAVTWLIERGYVEWKSDPKNVMSRTRFFQFKPDRVNADLMVRPGIPDSPKRDSRQSQKGSSGKAAKEGRTTVPKGTLDGPERDFLPYTEITHSEITSSSSFPSEVGNVTDEEDLTPLSDAIAEFVVATPGQIGEILRVVRLQNPDLSAADVAVAVPLSVPPNYSVKMWKYFSTALPGVVTSTRYLQELRRAQNSRAQESAQSDPYRRDRLGLIERLLAVRNPNEEDRDLLSDIERDHPQDVAEVRRRLKGGVA